MAKKQSKRVSPNEVYSYLISKGLSVPHAIGMLANIKHESNFVPTETGDNGTSAGLFMHHNDRYENLKKFTGGDLSNWKKQIDYALTEPVTKQYLKQKFSRPEEASYWFTTKWERPANAGVRAIERQGYVKEFLNNRGKDWNAPLYNPEGLTEEDIYASNLPQVEGEYQPEVPVDVLAQQTKRDQEVENLRAENKRLTEKEDAKLAAEREKDSKEKQELLAAEEEQMKQTQFADALAEVKPQSAYKPTEEFVGRDQELYKQNLGFEVQQAQNLFQSSIPAIEVQEAKYGGYFGDGGTYKSSDGTITNVITNRDGSKTVQVKTKDGKYYEKNVPMNYWAELDKTKEEYNDQKTYDKALNYTGVAAYPASIVSSSQDLEKGDYVSAGLGLIPVIGKEARAAQLARRNAYKFATNTLQLPHSGANAVRKGVSNALTTGTKAAQGLSLFEDGGEVDDSAEFNDFYQSLPISLQTEDNLDNLHSLWVESGKVSRYDEIDTPDNFDFERQVLEYGDGGKKPYVTTDPKEYAYRKKMYNDSLNLYNKGIKSLKGLSNIEYIPEKATNIQDIYNSRRAHYQIYGAKVDELGNKVGKIKPTGINYSTRKKDNEDIITFAYKKPTQKVVYQPKEKPAEEVKVQKPAERQETKPATSVSYPQGYQPYTLYGKVLDPEKYGYAPSTTGKPVQVAQFADTYNLKQKMDSYKKEGKTPWGTTFDLGGTFDKLLDPNNITAFKQKYGLQ